MDDKDKLIYELQQKIYRLESRWTVDGLLGVLAVDMSRQSITLQPIWLWGFCLF